MIGWPSDHGDKYSRNSGARGRVVFPDQPSTAGILFHTRTRIYIYIYIYLYIYYIYIYIYAILSQQFTLYYGQINDLTLA